MKCTGRTGFAAGSIRAESIGAESIGAEPIGAEPIRLIVSRPGKPSLFLGSDSADSAVRSAIVNMYEFPGNPESCASHFFFFFYFFFFFCTQPIANKRREK